MAIEGHDLGFNFDNEENLVDTIQKKLDKDPLYLRRQLKYDTLNLAMKYDALGRMFGDRDIKGLTVPLYRFVTLIELPQDTNDKEDNP